MLQRQRGIVLRSVRAGEADRILTLLMEDDRAVALRYHGIRASQKRSQLAVQPGNLVEVVYYEKTDAPVLSIKELSLLQEFQIPPTYENLQKQAAILALIQASAHGDAPGLFTLCTGALETLLHQVNHTQPNQTSHHPGDAPQPSSPPRMGAVLEAGNDSHSSEMPSAFLDLLGFLIVRIYRMQGLLASPERCSRCESALWKEDSWPPEDMQPSSWILPNLEFLCSGCSLLQNQRAQMTDTAHAFWIYLASRQRFHRFQESLTVLKGLKMLRPSGAENISREKPAGPWNAAPGSSDSLEFLQPNTSALLVRCIQDFLGNLKELRTYSD